MKLLHLCLICAAFVVTSAAAQTTETPPSVPPQEMPGNPNFPAGAGARVPLPNEMPRAGAPSMPGMPGNVGAPAFPPSAPAIPTPHRTIPEAPAKSGSAGLIAFLDSTTPLVQAFDFVLMIVAGIFCLRARQAPGLLLLAIGCFLSAVILLGFFIFGVTHGSGLLAQSAYVAARLLAPFELLLFAIAIVLVARRNAGAR